MHGAISVQISIVQTSKSHNSVKNKKRKESKPYSLNVDEMKQTSELTITRTIKSIKKDMVRNLLNIKLIKSKIKEEIKNLMSNLHVGWINMHLSLKVQFGNILKETFDC